MYYDIFCTFEWFHHCIHDILPTSFRRSRERARVLLVTCHSSHLVAFAEASGGSARRVSEFRPPWREPRKCFEVPRLVLFSIYGVLMVFNGNVYWFNGWWMVFNDWLVVTGTWLLFFHILGIIIPIDSYFSGGFKPPTRRSSDGVNV